VGAFRITKNGKLPTKREAFGQLTRTLRHAWPRVRLKLKLLLAYKRRGRGTIQGGKIIAKKLCQISKSVLSQPFSLASSFRRNSCKSSWRTKEEEEPRIRIEERWMVSKIIVS
jgi:hypothetical protein